MRNTTLNYTDQQLTTTINLLYPLDVPPWAWAALLVKLVALGVKLLTKVTPRAMKVKIALVDTIMLLVEGAFEVEVLFSGASITIHRASC